VQLARGFLFTFALMQKITQIYGIRAVLEAIRSDEPIDKVFIQRGLKGDLFKELEGTLRKNQIST